MKRNPIEIDFISTSGPVCDFCSGTPIYARYRAETFRKGMRPGIGGQSIGDWAACRVCYELINQDKWDMIAKRSLEKLLKKMKKAGHVIDSARRSEMLHWIKGLHQQFREFRTDDPPEILRKNPR